MKRGMKLPKTWFGWKRLFWITLGRCPQCHRATIYDPWDYGLRDIVYCMPCGGVILPDGFFSALRWNYRSVNRGAEGE